MSEKLRSVSKIESNAPRPAKLSHIVIRTGNLSRLRSWYLNVLVGEISYENDVVCFVTFDEEHHRIGLLQMPGSLGGLSSPPSQGLDHVSFTYAELGQLLATYRRLKGLKIEPYWTINHGPTVSMYYRDPDGNRVELQVDVFGTRAEANAFLQEYYSENFIGVIFDPEEMIRRYEAGEPIQKLLRRPVLSQGMTPWDMYRP